MTSLSVRFAGRIKRILNNLGCYILMKKKKMIYNIRSNVKNILKRRLISIVEIVKILYVKNVLQKIMLIMLKTVKMY